MTSSSYSFHPMMDSSRRTSVVGLWRSPAPAISSNSAWLYAIPEPNPPIVKEGRTTTGYLSSSTPAKHSCIECAIIDLAESPPTFATIPLKVSRSSPRLIASTFAPISLVPYFSKEPRSYSCMAAFKAVCPPKVASTASGRSFSRIFSIISGVIGSI